MDDFKNQAKKVLTFFDARVVLKIARRFQARDTPLISSDPLTEESPKNQNPRSTFSYDQRDIGTPHKKAEITIDEKTAPAPLHLDEELSDGNTAPELAKLQVTAGNDFGRHYVIEEKSYTLGRGVDNDIVLTDISVSRRHLRIEKDGMFYIAHDSGSGNGTLINGKEIKGSTRLNNGDTIEIGNTVMTFTGPESEILAPPILATPPLIQDDPSFNTVAGKKSSGGGFAKSPAQTIQGQPLPKPVISRPDSEDEPTQFAGRPNPPASDYDNPAPTFLPSTPSHWADLGEPEPATQLRAQKPVPPAKLHLPEPNRALPIKSDESIPSELLKVTQKGAPSGRLPIQSPKSSAIHPVPYPSPNDIFSQGASQTQAPTNPSPYSSPTAPPKQDFKVPPASTRSPGLGASASNQVSQSYSPKPRPLQGSKTTADWGRLLLLLLAGALLLTCVGMTVAYFFAKNNNKKELKQGSQDTQLANTEPEEALPPKNIPSQDRPQTTATVATPLVKNEQTPKTKPLIKQDTFPRTTVKTTPESPRTKPKKNNRFVKDDSIKRPTKRKTSGNPEAQARKLYMDGDYAAASKILRNAADDIEDDDEADELLDVAAGFSKIGNLINAAESTSSTNPQAALKAYKQAYILDQKLGSGVHEDELRSNLRKIAPKAARAAMAKKDYGSAKQAAEDADRFGASSEVESVFTSLERMAEKKLKEAEDAEDDDNTRKAKSLYKEILQMAPKSSSAYSDARKGLRRL